MHHDPAFKGILFSMTLVGIVFAIDAGAQEPEAGNVPEQPCDNAQTVTACKVDEDDAAMDCGTETLCSDASIGESPDWSTFVGESGEATATNWCTSITGSYDDDTIRIGAIYYWYGPLQTWYTLGDFGYCKNHVLTFCDAATNPLPVKPYQGDDIVGTVGSIYTCVSQSTAIGPWSSLDSVWQGIKLNVYGCAGWDWIYGTPNADLLIGGSGDDMIQARAGSDSICGDFGTEPIQCAFCSSGNNCTSAGGPDSGSATGMDNLHGESGNDTICGQGGDDDIRGGTEDDYLYGQGGCDDLWGDDGYDHIYTANWVIQTAENSEGEDDGCTTKNKAWGGPSYDDIYGSSRVDYLWGDDGNGYIYSLGGSDKICGRVNFPTAGGLWVNGGPGTDVVLLCAAGEAGTSWSAYGGAGDGDTACYLGGPGEDDIGSVTLNGDYAGVPDGSNDCCDCGLHARCGTDPTYCEMFSCPSACQPADFTCPCS